MRADRPELLAPAGSPEALQAAVRCGADAVYMGLSRFSARAAAQNFTPEELAAAVAYAHACGADFVKLFPAAGLSPAYIRAVLAPLPHIRLLAVGGIREEDLPEYRKAGVCGFGIGSRLVDKSLVDAGDYDGITALAEKYTEGLCHG